MRTIVAFLAFFVAAAGQNAEIERIEKFPDKPVDRATAQRILVNLGAAPEKVRADRREFLPWLITHQPESRLFDEPFTQMWERGRLGDPEGFARAAQLWKDLAAKPGASPKAIAHAAAFFKLADPAQGFAILDAAERDHPHDPDLARARGILDAALVLGISGVRDISLPLYLTTASRRESPAAANAQKEIEASADAHMVGGAGEFLSRGGSLYFLVGDDDFQWLGEKWLRRARELNPSSDEWNAVLANVVRVRAYRTSDQAEKLRLILESASLLPEAQRRGMLPDIAMAEFEASDDAAAERDARTLVASTRAYLDYYFGQTVLGRLALARGNQAGAKEHLLASVKPPASFKNPTIQPNVLLAQEILDSGDRETVLAFLAALRPLWTFDQGRLDHMINFVKRSSSPLDLQQMTIQPLGFDFRNRIAPDFEVKDADGKTFTRDQLSGKVVALVFGTGPGIDKLTRDFSTRGVEFFHAAVSREDPLARKFEVESDPTLIVLDRRGRVVSYLPGKSPDAAWRREIDNAMSGAQPNNPNSVPVPEPKTAVVSGTKATVSWEPVANAESYLVEWDSRDEKGWVFDREGTVRVIPTRETSAILDLMGLTRVRWRVVAVPQFGQGSAPSAWKEIEGVPITKIYK